MEKEKKDILKNLKYIKLLILKIDNLTLLNLFLMKH